MLSLEAVNPLERLLMLIFELVFELLELIAVLLSRLPFLYKLSVHVWRSRILSAK